MLFKSIDILEADIPFDICEQSSTTPPLFLITVDFLETSRFPHCGTLVLLLVRFAERAHKMGLFSHCSFQCFFVCHLDLFGWVHKMEDTGANPPCVPV